MYASRDSQDVFFSRVFVFSFEIAAVVSAASRFCLDLAARRSSAALATAAKAESWDVDSPLLENRLGFDAWLCLVFGVLHMIDTPFGIHFTACWVSISRVVVMIYYTL